MFTIKHVLFDGIPERSAGGKVMVGPDNSELKESYVFLRQRNSVDVHTGDSPSFSTSIELERDRINGDEESTEGVKEMLLEALNTYKAIIYSTSEDGEEHEYFVAETEKVYITDRYGNTVYCI